MAREGLRRDGRAQMMLLTAFVLVIAFVSLTAMVARVAQLGKTTARERANPAIEELQPMVQGANDAIAAMYGKYRPIGSAAEANKTLYEAAVVAELNQVKAIEAGRGYVVTWRIVCVTGGNGQALLTLDDGTMQVTVRTTTYPRPTAACTPASVLAG